MSEIASQQKLGPAWSAVAALSDELKYAWLAEHLADVALVSEAERRQHLKELLEEAQALQPERRDGLIRAALFALLDLPDASARVIVQSWAETVRLLPDRAAYADSESLVTVARQIPEQDAGHLADLWPRMFGEDLAETA